MSFESPPIERIQTENVEDRDRKLMDQIAMISLRYARERWKKEEKEGVEKSFSDYLINDTPFEQIVLKPLEELQSPENREYWKMWETFRKALRGRLTQIDLEHSSDQDILDIGNDIRTEVGTYVAEVQKCGGETPLRADTGRRDGLLQWESVQTGMQASEDSAVWNVLKERGFSVADGVIAMHFRPAFTGEGDMNSSAIKKSFGALAEYVVDNAPSTKAIIGTSWLMDTPIAKRLGFIAVPEIKTSMADFSAWYQLIDANGQIHQERLRKLAETGNFPFRNTFAYVPIEEFLRRYLPEKRKQKGPIVLEDVDEERLQHVKDLQASISGIKKDWDQAVAQDGRVDFDQFLENHTPLREILDLLDAEDKETYKNFFYDMGRQGVGFADMGVHQSDAVRSASEHMNRVLNTGLYRKREVDLRSQ